MTAISGDALTGDIVLLDFLAECCRVCRLVAPELERIALSDPHLTLEKINVADAAEQATMLNVTGLSTLIFHDPGRRELQRPTGSSSGRWTKTAMGSERARHSEHGER